MKVIIRAPLFPTEDEKRVLKALANIFPEIKFRIEGEGKFREIIGECICSHCLEKLRNKLRTQRILDSARSYIFKGRESGFVKFYLNKQAAFVGKISFCAFEFGESPLGAITVIVELGDEDFEKFVNWLAPATVNGRPVNEENEFPCK